MGIFCGIRRKKAVCPALAPMHRFSLCTAAHARHPVTGGVIRHFRQCPNAEPPARPGVLEKAEPVAPYMKARWHQTMIGFQARPRNSRPSEFTPSTTPSTRSLWAGSGAPTGSSKYMTLITRR